MHMPLLIKTPQRNSVLPFKLSMIRLILAGLVCILLPSESMAAVYKCDDHGKVTYSGTKCAENAQVLSSANDQPINEHGNLTLYLNAHHSFTTQGSINDLPVTFVVD